MVHKKGFQACRGLCACPIMAVHVPKYRADTQVRPYGSPSIMVRYNPPSPIGFSLR
ncbi:MAG: hypothetical protein JW927_21485 [Deltaproteobacteria bacterium]|nr:hypothetical protein [Deltaproteobacteria bacterium]